MSEYLGPYEYRDTKGELHVWEIIQRGEFLIAGTVTNAVFIEEIGVEIGGNIDHALQDLCEVLCIMADGEKPSGEYLTPKEMGERIEQERKDQARANLPSFVAPSAWACYLINGDASGLEEGEQEEIDRVREGLGICIDCEEVGFLNRPDYGIAGDCFEYWFEGGVDNER